MAPNQEVINLCIICYTWHPWLPSGIFGISCLKCISVLTKLQQFSFGAGQTGAAPPHPEWVGPSCHSLASGLWRWDSPRRPDGTANQPTVPPGEGGRGQVGPGWPRPAPLCPAPARPSSPRPRWFKAVRYCVSSWFVSYSYYHSSSIIIIIINNIIIIIITTSWNRLRYILIYIAILKEYLDLYIVRYKNHNTSFITQKPYNWNSNDLWNQGQFYNRKNLACRGRGGCGAPPKTQ